MCKFDPRESTLSILLLPDDVVHLVFLKLNFKDKVNTGLVCKQWDHLLRAGTAAARHWVINYSVDRIITSKAFTGNEGSVGGDPNLDIGRWFIKRAPAIKSVHVSAALSATEKGTAVRNLLQTQLPLLAGCLTKYVSHMELTFRYGFPFDGPQLSNPAFLALLCPMVKHLRLERLTPINPVRFSAICELTSLEELSISGSWDEDYEADLDMLYPQEALQELTSDISKLVNLRVLNLGCNETVDSIPDSVSCLQKLEHLRLQDAGIVQLPIGLGALKSLISLRFELCQGLRFPPHLQGLKSLTSVTLDDCCLMAVPEQLSDLAALTSLDLRDNEFSLPVGSDWWPLRLSRLTQLEELLLPFCHIVSLPVHMSLLGRLRKLDLSFNLLRSLPDELSSFRTLEELALRHNEFPEAPVFALRGMTAITKIDLSFQRFGGDVDAPAFQVPSPLLPILHPGLVELNLEQARGSLDASGWDPISLVHLGRAMVEVSDRMPVLTLLLGKL